MRKRGIYWVTIGPEPHMATCQRCGRHEPPPETPTPLRAAILYMRYVAEKHRWCLATDARPVGIERKEG
jgi:hypothetical protein